MSVLTHHFDASMTMHPVTQTVADRDAAQTAVREAADWATQVCDLTGPPTITEHGPSMWTMRYDFRDDTVPPQTDVFHLEDS